MDPMIWLQVWHMLKNLSPLPHQKTNNRSREIIWKLTTCWFSWICLSLFGDFLLFVAWDPSNPSPSFTTIWVRICWVLLPSIEDSQNFWRNEWEFYGCIPLPRMHLPKKRCTALRWGFPKIGLPQKGWFVMENPMNKWMIWGYHHFRKHPDGISFIPARSFGGHDGFCWRWAW